MLPFTAEHVALPATVTQALPVPQSAGVQPPTVGVQTPVLFTHVSVPVQVVAAQGLSSSTAASSKRKSVGSRGTSMLERATTTFDRVLPPLPASIWRKAMIGLPPTICIFE